MLFWLRSGKPKNEAQLTDSLGAFGLYLDGELPEPELFEVYDENRQALLFFCTLNTQWRTADGRFTGLDYAGVWAAMKMRRINNSVAVFDQVQEMERAVLNEVNAGQT